MLLTTSKKIQPIDGTLVDYSEEGDKFQMIHMQHVDPLFKQNREERKHDPKTVGRANWRKIGSIPALLLTQHPEWLENPKLMEKFLSSSEGEPYRTVRRI